MCIASPAVKTDLCGDSQLPLSKVGLCLYAPNEHIWSFDHITGRGRSLLEADDA